MLVSSPWPTCLPDGGLGIVDFTGDIHAAWGPCTEECCLPDLPRPRSHERSDVQRATHYSSRATKVIRTPQSKSMVAPDVSLTAKDAIEGCLSTIVTEPILHTEQSVVRLVEFFELQDSFRHKRHQHDAKHRACPNMILSPPTQRRRRM